MKGTNTTGGVHQTPAPAEEVWQIDIYQVTPEDGGPCYVADLLKNGERVLPEAIGAVGRVWGTRFTVFTAGGIWDLVGASADLIYRAFVRFLSKTWGSPEFKYNTLTLETQMKGVLADCERTHVVTLRLPNFRPFIDPNGLY